MSPASPNGTGDEDHSGPHRLVCGACERVLEGVHPNQARADQAADEHAVEEHPDSASVVILAVPVDLPEDRRGDVVAIAEAAQRRVDERSRRDGEGA